MLTLIVFPLLGFILFWIVEGQYQTILDIFQTKLGVGYELLIGLVTGTAFGFIAWQFVKSNYMKPVLEKYGQVVKSLDLNWMTIVFLSFCAGVGEELFFRGVLQDYLGVIITAVIFVLIHGYLNPFDKIIFSYGLLMTALIIAVGYLDRYVGLTSAMAAHMMIDVVLFHKLSTTNLLPNSVWIKSDVLNAQNSQ